jgi:hypothetical protein
MLMQNYIVRIYRRDELDPDGVTGLVEAVETGAIQPFSTLSELATLLAGTSTVMEENAKAKLCFASA